MKYSVSVSLSNDTHDSPNDIGSMSYAVNEWTKMYVCLSLVILVWAWNIYKL